MKQLMFTPDTMVVQLGATLNPTDRMKAIEEASQLLLTLALEPALQQQIRDNLLVAQADLKSVLEEATFAYTSATLEKRMALCDLYTRLQEHFYLTPAQLLHLLPGGISITRRLCQRHLHFEAFRLALHLDADLSEILTHWSREAVSE